MDHSEKDFKIFGLGLSKTGTSSLGDALNELGFPTIHYPFDELTYNELRQGNYQLSILNKYRGIVDIPVAPYYAQLDAAYPGSKFILTVRDVESWLRSAEKHWELMMTWWDNYPDFKKFHEFISVAVYGCIDFSRERFRFVYQTHLLNIKNYFSERKDDLLVMDICDGEGWRSLCDFLHVPVPAIPFPHANEWMHKLMEATHEFKATVAPGKSFILIDQEGFGEEFAAGRTKLLFTQENGLYNGEPATDEKAVQELERLLKLSPDYLVIGWPSFWCTEYYKNFYEMIQRSFTSVLKNERLIIYNLKEGNTKAILSSTAAAESI